MSSVRPRHVDAAAQFNPDATAEEILAAGPEATAAWAQLEHHRAVLDGINRIAAALAFQFGYGPIDHRVAGYLAGVDHAGHLADADRLFPQATGTGGLWHRLAAAGYKLKLNTAAEAKALIANAAPAPPARMQRVNRDGFIAYEDASASS